MADSILALHEEKLLSAFSGNIESVSPQFLSKNLIDEEVLVEIQQASHSNREKAELVLGAVKTSIARDSSKFAIVLEILNDLPPPENEEDCEWIKEMEEEFLKLPPPQKRPRIGDSPSSIPPQSESPELRVIREFWGLLVLVIGIHVHELSDQLFAKDLITEEAYKNILCENHSNDINVRMLLISIRDTIITDSRCYNVFRQILEERLDKDMVKLLSEMDDKYSEYKKMNFDTSEAERTEIDRNGFGVLGNVAASPEVEVLRRFTARIVPAISGCMMTMTDLCYNNGLVSGSEQKQMFESTEGSEDKARKLLVALRRNLALEEASSKRVNLFNVFLSLLRVSLPIQSRERLLSEMTDVHKELCELCDTARHNVPTSQVQYETVIQSMKNSLEFIHQTVIKKTELEQRLSIKEKENKQLIAKLKTLVEARKRSSKKAEKRIAELKSKIRECESEIIELKKEIQKQEEKIERQEMKVKQGEVIVQESGRDVVAKLKAAENTELEMKAKIKDLTKLVNDHKRTIYVLKRRLASHELSSEVTSLDISQLPDSMRYNDDIRIPDKTSCILQ